MALLREAQNVTLTSGMNSVPLDGEPPQKALAVYAFYQPANSPAGTTAYAPCVVNSYGTPPGGGTWALRFTPASLPPAGQTVTVQVWTI